MTDARQGPAIAEVVGRYDRGMYQNHPMLEYFGSDFGNFGWWEPTTVLQREACENMMERLLAWIPDRKGRILDVACGKGATTQYLLRGYRPEQVFAVNISHKQLLTTRTNARGAGLAVMDAARLGLADETFDNLVCVEAAFHFDTRERFLGEARRVLKPGGRLVLSDILMTREAERRRPMRTEENYLEDPDAYRALGRRAGFAEVEVVNATEQCWRRGYHDVVRHFHEKLLARDITADDLKRILDVVYALVPDIQYYLLACLRKATRP